MAFRPALHIRSSREIPDAGHAVIGLVNTTTTCSRHTSHQCRHFGSLVAMVIFRSGCWDYTKSNRVSLSVIARRRRRQIGAKGLLGTSTTTVRSLHLHLIDHERAFGRPALSGAKNVRVRSPRISSEPLPRIT